MIEKYVETTSQYKTNTDHGLAISRIGSYTYMTNFMGPRQQFVDDEAMSLGYGLSRALVELALCQWRADRDAWTAKRDDDEYDAWVAKRSLHRMQQWNALCEMVIMEHYADVTGVIKAQVMRCLLDVRMSGRSLENSDVDVDAINESVQSFMSELGYSADVCFKYS